jgi:thymidine kinase
MIHLILGPMYAGKTSKLLKLYKELGGIILDYAETNGEGTVVNHNKDSLPCVKCNLLKSAEWMTDGPVYINEAQFFPDLLDFVRKWEMHFDIYLFGLDGDFMRQPMGQILQVIPLCDTVEKLKGKCSKCSDPSLFSKRITSDISQYLLDETAYIPLCRNCYLTYKCTMIL